MTREKIYPLVSFEEKTIKTWIVSESNDKAHTLFYEEQHVDFPIDFTNIATLETDKIVKTLRTIFKNASSYLIHDCKDVVINITKIKLSKGDHKIENLSGESYSDILNQVHQKIYHTIEKDSVRLVASKVTSWTVKNKKTLHLEKDINKYENIKVNYVTYWIEQKIFNVITNIFDKFNMNVTTVLNNNTIFDNLSNQSDEVFYDIRSSVTYIYTLGQKYKLEIGYKNIFDEFMEKLRITDFKQLQQIFDIYYLIRKEDKNCAIFNKFNGVYLKNHSLTGQQFSDLNHRITCNLISSLKGRLKTRINENKNITINVNDECFKLLQAEKWEKASFKFLSCRQEMPFMSNKNFYLIYHVYDFVRNKNTFLANKHLIDTQEDIIIKPKHSVHTQSIRTRVVSPMGGKN